MWENTYKELRDSSKTIEKKNVVKGENLDRFMLIYYFYRILFLRENDILWRDFIFTIPVKGGL